MDKSKIVTWLAILGGITLFVIVMNGLDTIVRWYQQATAIVCKDDPRHTHIYCRRPDGSLEEWRSEGD
jgi:hypothetical protein